MNTDKELSEQLFRLVYIVRSIAMKCALTAVEPDPKLNFWRLVHGNQLDVAILEWCKVFGSDAEATHWKNVVPVTEQDGYRTKLLAALGIYVTDWNTYWEEMKRYRDCLVAHHIENGNVSNYPKLDLALKSSFFHYKYVLGKLRARGMTEYPNDLEDYYGRIERQAREIAKLATTATSEMQEQVY